MLIQELTTQESLEILRGMSLGRLGCARGGQPYVVPIHFAVNNHYLYSFSTMGKKVEWMRANPLVCVEADQVASSQHWVSIVVSGRYEELPDTLEWQSVRTFAHDLLQKKAMWWEPGYATTILEGGAQRPLAPLFYRIHVVEISGRRAISDQPVPDWHNTDKFTGTRGLGEAGFIQKILKHFRPKPTSERVNRDSSRQTPQTSFGLQNFSVRQDLDCPTGGRLSPAVAISHGGPTNVRERPVQARRAHQRNILA